MGQKQKKVSGILLPISALPGPYGIGDCGPAAFRFVDWLHRAQQHRWQILPLTIPDSTGSPYMSLSGEAGNWLFISPEVLWQQGLLPKSYRMSKPRSTGVLYRTVMRTKWQLIRSSYLHFVNHSTRSQRTSFRTFSTKQSWWLTDYILFQALKDRHQQQPWWSWEKKWRRPAAARRHLDGRLQRQMQLHAYAQWLFAEQWNALHAYANRRGVKIIGDLPFFVRTDSVDVWTKPDLFLLNRRGLPTVVAGVPPDYFSNDGQRWGFPLYQWPAHRRELFRWWVERLRLLRQRCDLIRFDHFQGLVRTWQIPAAAKTARRGQWVPSPGPALLRAVRLQIAQLYFIAEDLGSVEVTGDNLRRQFHLPTIRVLQFGWNGMPNNPHLASAITPDEVLYTANHDTNTTVGWWRQEAQDHERRQLIQQFGSSTDLAWKMIGLAWSTPAGTTIASVQDVLELGSAARFNHPGRKRGNWAWRLGSKQLTRQQANRLAKLTTKYGRA